MADAMLPHDDEASRRIDKWLWCARLVKTRGAGAALAQSGRIRVSRGGRAADRITKSSYRLLLGDILTLPLGRTVRVLSVREFAGRRGPAGAARRLYDEIGQEVPAPRGAAVRHEAG